GSRTYHQHNHWAQSRTMTAQTARQWARTAAPWCFETRVSTSPEALERRATVPERRGLARVGDGPAGLPMALAPGFIDEAVRPNQTAALPDGGRRGGRDRRGRLRDGVCGFCITRRRHVPPPMPMQRGGRGGEGRGDARGGVPPANAASIAARSGWEHSEQRRPVS
ncbi:MAG TPA: hypothetical protein VJ779_01455, partial [Acetobacteraceae bacterium]|nr:hypothetical protein [Acetobacteraceae bacterium]